MSKYFLTIVFAAFAAIASSQAVITVSPEAFGAKGDGMHDDAPALNACIRSGKTIVLSKGGKYALHSRLVGIENDRFELLGNDATLVLADDYPLKEYDQIFGFADHEVQREGFKMEHVRIECFLGQKFSERSKRGDTYIICLGKCRKAEIKYVDFVDFGEYNNVSFLVNTGANLRFSDCHVTSHSKSLQGGALWVMNKYLRTMSLEMRRVTVDYDTRDECFCIAHSAASGLAECDIKSRIRDCTFTGPGQVQSSGFLIEYAHSDQSVTRFDVQFNACSFISRGLYPHRIIFYQSGAVPGNDFKTVYKKCRFVFKPQTHSEVGLIAMLPRKLGIDKQHIRTEFKSCSFDISNVCSIIGDKDGETAGTCVFNNCDIITDEALFVRKYNPGAGDITIQTVRGTMKGAGTRITTESIEAKNTRFK